MKLKFYLSQQWGRQAQLAKAIGAHASDVSFWAGGKRPIPIRFAVLIEQYTQGAVTRQEMFPNDWHRIWPELIGKPFLAWRDAQ